MSTAKLGQHSVSAREELDALRAALDVRLAASQRPAGGVSVEFRGELETVLIEMEAARIAAASSESAAEEARAALRAERLASATLRRMIGEAEERIVALEQALEALQAPPAAAQIRAAAAPEQIPPARDVVTLPSQPLREADRQPFHEQIQIRVDGEAALLVDLSVRGAQVVSDNALKPNRAVKILLPMAGQPLSCKGQVVWARLEPTAAPGSLRYRAGMLFTSADQAAIAKFMTNHAAQSTSGPVAASLPR